MSAAKRLIPLLNRVLIEKMAAPNKSLGGIMLPDTAVPKVRRTTQTWVHRMGLPAQAGCTKLAENTFIHFFSVLDLLRAGLLSCKQCLLMRPHPRDRRTQPRHLPIARAL